ncbi:MAG TPA: ABC transporter ATP-binding protein [Firmicutes bacterium]|nr:ABC transporter ATP-binding protein [Bacillota bacterium]
MAQNNSSISIEILDFQKRYGDLMAVRGINLTVRKGTFFGFVGPNGAGKSTTINAMVGLIRPSAGTIKIAGFDISKNPIEVKERIGFMPEEVTLYERLTAGEYLEFVGQMYGMNPKFIRERIKYLLELLDLDNIKYMGTFSLGMKKKAALAAALIHLPPVIILDEPFSGIDAMTGSRIRAVLNEMVADSHTVFFSSHVLETVERISTRIGIINKGRLLAEGTLQEIRQAAGCPDDWGLEEIFLKLVGAESGGSTWTGSST